MSHFYEISVLQKAVTVLPVCLHLSPSCYLSVLANRQVIDTIRAFDLRAHKLSMVNSKSFLKDTQIDKYYVQTIGKGGKY